MTRVRLAREVAIDGMRICFTVEAEGDYGPGVRECALDAMRTLLEWEEPEVFAPRPTETPS
jgi:hypothetical protein